MTDPIDRLDNDLARWFDVGPRGAPPELVADTLGRTRRTDQRPAWLAIALGAPTLDSPRALTRLSRSQMSLLAVVALVAILVALAISAGGLRNDRRLGVLPSTSPRASLEPRTSPVPSPTAIGITTPTPYTLVERPDLSFEVAWSRADGVSSPWDYFSLAPGPPGITFGIGGCTDNICMRGYVAMTSGPIADGVAAFNATTGPVTLTGGTLDELVASWSSKVGPVRDRQPVELGGMSGVRIGGSGFDAILGIHDGRLFVMQALRNIVDQLDETMLDIFVPRFRPLDSPIAINGRHTFLAGVAAGVDPSWTVVSDNAQGLFVGINAPGAPGAGTSWASWVRTIVTTTQSFTDVEQDLLASEPTAEAWLTETTVDGKPAHLILRTDRDPVAIVDDGPVVETITAHVDPTIPAPAGPRRWADGETLLRAFLASVDLNPSASITWRGLRLTLPARWPIAGIDGPTLTITPVPASGLSGTSAARFQISALAPGATLLLQRPSGTTTPTFSISGGTLAELASRVEEGLGVPRTTRAAVTIGGQSGYSWGVALGSSYVVGAERILVIERTGTFYVVTAVVFLEGPDAAGFQTLLDGISFP